MRTFSYRPGAEIPYLTLPWQYEVSSGVWADLDMTSGYTFSLTLTPADSSTPTLTKTTNIVGLASGVRVEWQSGELDIAPGRYRLDLRATSGGADRDYRPSAPLEILIFD